MGMMSAYRLPEPAPRIEVQPAEPDLGQTAAALTLAQDLAEVLDMPVETTWWSICNAPPEMNYLLGFPEGWTACAGYVARDLGVPEVEYRPEVH